MMSGWNKENGKLMLLYLVLYMAGTAVTCFLGALHPVVFVCYQVIAGVLLSGIVITAFRKMKLPCVAVIFSLAIILVFVLLGDASVWHCAPLIVMAVIAEVVRRNSSYSWKGDVLATAVMTFSTFGFYGQIWFNRAYTYEAAIEEMPVGYAETLMNCSPDWSFAAVVLLGILLSVLVSHLTAKIFHLEQG